MGIEFMNTLTPQDPPEQIGDKLMENLGQQMLVLFDMTDERTSEFYWVFMKMQGVAIAAQLKAAIDLGQLKPAKP